MRITGPRILTAVAALALGATRAEAQALTLPLRYKPRLSFAESSSMMAEEGAAGVESKVHPAVEDLQVELDAAGNMVSATVAVEKLQALNPNLWAYFASVNFQGDQTIDVLIDTGSAGLGIPVDVPANWSGKDFQKLDPRKAQATRLPCADPRCRGSCDQPGSTHFCGPNGGSCVKLDGQDTCSFAWLYGDGSSATGVLMTSPIEVGGLWVNSTWGGIIKATDSFFEMPRGGGIMGLAYGGYSLCDSEYSCFPPAVDDIIAQRGLENKFAICASGNDAALIIGRGDESLQAGPIKYVPLQQPFGFYWVNVVDVHLGGESLVGATSRLRGVMGMGAKPNMLALVDTGNSATYFPEFVFDTFRDKLQVQLGATQMGRRIFPRFLDQASRSIFNGYAVYIAPEILNTLPKVDILLDNGAVLSLTPDQYTTEFKADGIPVPLRALKIARGPRFVFGQTVLNHMYIEVDRAGKTIGFAPSKPGCTA